MDNYNPNVRQKEDHTPEEQDEEDAFLDKIVQSDIMKMAADFLVEKKYLSDASEAKSLLKELWFEIYDRDGTSATVLGSR